MKKQSGGHRSSAIFYEYSDRDWGMMRNANTLWVAQEAYLRLRFTRA